LEGAFELRDGATAKLILMRHEAVKTDKAFRKLGLTMDLVGSNQKLQRLGTVGRSVRTLGLEAENAAKRTDHLARRSKQADAAMGGWGGRLRMVTRGLKEFGMELFKLARPGAMLLGLPTLLGLAGQGVGSLAGSLIALAPRIADLGAASAVAIPGITGLAGGMMLLSRAGKLLGQAMQGGTAGAQAIRQGGPALASVVRQLRAMRGELRGLSRAGSAPIFRGIRDVLPLLRGQMPALRGMLGDLGGAVGDAIRGAGRGLLGNRTFMADLRNLTGQGGGVIRAGGAGLTNLAKGLATVGAAARPLTLWLTRLVVLWSQHFAATMAARRASGQLSTQFDRARKSLTGLGHFLHDVWVALRQLGRDARPAGEVLYRWLGAVGRAWRVSAGNADRNVRLTRQFLGMTRGFIALGNLVGHLSAAIFNMGSGQGFPKVVSSLDKMIPALTRFLGMMANTFGPPLARLLGTLATTFETLGGGAGSPVVMLLSSLNGILGAVNGLVKALGPLGGVLTKAFEAVLLLRFLSKLKLVEVGWRRVQVAAIGAAEAETAAAGVPFGMRPGAFFGGFGRGLGGRLRGMRGTLGRFARGGEVAAGEQMTLEGGAMLGRGGMLRAGARGGLGMLGRAGMLGLGVASKFLLPLAGIMGLFGAFSAQRSGGLGHQALQTGYGFVNAASGGLIGAGLGALGVHPLQTPEQKAARLVGISQKHLQVGLGRADAGSSGMRRLNREVDVLQVTMQGFARDQTDAGKQYRQQLQQEIDARKSVIDQLKSEAATRGARAGNADIAAANAAFRRAGGGQRGIRAGQRVLQDAIRATPGGGAAAINERTAAEVGLLAGTPAAQRPAMRAWIRRYEASQGQRVGFGPRYTGYSGTTYGGVYRGGMGVRTDILRTMSGAERAQEGRQRAFTPLENALLANLVGSGFKERSARRWIQDWENRGSTGPIVPPRVSRWWANWHRQRGLRRGRAINPPAAAPAAPSAAFAPGPAAGLFPPNPLFPMNPLFPPHATGGRLGGHGLGDTVALPGAMAAPGELVVNRHTERRVNAALGTTTLDAMVKGENKRHSDRFAQGGRFHGYPMPHGDIATLADQVLSTFPGLSVTSTTRGTHARHSYHGLGMAVDIGGNPALMQSAGAWIAATMGGKLLEGIHNSSLSIKDGKAVKPGYWGAPTWAQHLNHIHIAAGKGSATSAAGGVSGQATTAGKTQPADPLAAVRRSQYNIKRVLGGDSGSVFGLGGLPIVGDQGSLVAQLGAAGASTSGGASAAPSAVSGKLNRTFPRFLQGAGGRHAQLTPAQVTAIAQSVGLPGSMFEKIAHGESSYYPGVQQRDPGDGNVGYGLWQMTPHAWGTGSSAMKHMQSLGGIPAMFNPVKNAMMAKYLYDHAGSKVPGAPGFPWYGTRYLERGGRLHQWGGWHQGGMDGVFSTPTMIGVGEGGPERVTVTKSGQGRGAVTINARFYITGGQPGQVRREVEAALHSFADELERHYGSDVASGRTA
jgi:hypothetical protein